MLFNQQQPTEDRSGITYHFANLASACATDSEVIVTLGVAPAPGDDPDQQLAACRVYMNWFTGKRFSLAMQMAIERHTKAFGPIAAAASSSRPPAFAIRAVYANFVRLSGNPEELVIDFGMNPEAAAPGKGPPPALHSQVAMQYSTAKQLAEDVARLIADYERSRGNIELSIPQRRV